MCEHFLNLFYIFLIYELSFIWYTCIKEKESTHYSCWPQLGPIKFGYATGLLFLSVMPMFYWLQVLKLIGLQHLHGSTVSIASFPLTVVCLPSNINKTVEEGLGVGSSVPDL